MKNQSILLVKDICKGTFTNIDGVALKKAISNALCSSDFVILSFSGVDAVSSSFLNSSIGDIIDEYGLDYLRNKIKITKYTASLADVIKKYISSYTHQLAS